PTPPTSNINEVEVQQGTVVGVDMNSMGEPGKSDQSENKSKQGFLKKKPVLITLTALLLLGSLAVGWMLIGSDNSNTSEGSDRELIRLGVTPTLIDGEATYKSGEN